MGHYVIYNDTVYELDKSITEEPRVSRVHPTPTYSDVSHQRDNKETMIKINLSNMDKTPISNGEAVQSMLEKLKKDNTKQIRKLSPKYRLYVEYALSDTTIGEIVDEKILIKEGTAEPFVHLLGVSTNVDVQELLSRIGLDIKFEIATHYQDSYPFGILRKTCHSYRLYIKRIYVEQLAMATFSVTPMEEEKIVHDKYLWPYRPCSYGDKHGRDPYENHRMMEDHPSMCATTTKSMTTIYPKPENSVIIYDSARIGINFDPINIDYKPRCIRIKITFNLEDVIVAIKSSVSEVLEENANKQDTEPDDTITSEPGNPSTDNGANEDKTDTSGSDTDISEPKEPDTNDTKTDNE